MIGRERGQADETRELRGGSRGRFLSLIASTTEFCLSLLDVSTYTPVSKAQPKQYKHESCDFRVLQSCEIGTMRPQMYEDDNKSFSVVVDPAVKIIKFDVVNVELKA